MPAPTPRRTRYNNRRTSLSLPAQQRQLVMALLDATGNEVTMAWTETQANIVKTGVPRLYSQDLAVYAESADFPDADTIVFTFPGAITGGDVLTLAPYDPAVRSPLGGYIDGGRWEIPIAPSPPVSVATPWSNPTIEDLFGFTLDLDDSVLRIGVMANANVTNPPTDSGGAQFLGVQWVDAAKILVTFDNDIFPSATITFPVDCDIVVNDTGGFLEAGSWEIPE